MGSFLLVMGGCKADPQVTAPAVALLPRILLPYRGLPSRAAHVAGYLLGTTWPPRKPQRESRPLGVARRALVQRFGPRSTGVCEPRPTVRASCDTMLLLKLLNCPVVGTLDVRSSLFASSSVRHTATLAKPQCLSRGRSLSLSSFSDRNGLPVGQRPRSPSAVVSVCVKVLPARLAPGWLQPFLWESGRGQSGRRRFETCLKCPWLAPVLHPT